MERRTINVKIDADIYNYLHLTSTSTNQSKTQIIEKALSQYLGLESEESTSIQSDQVEVLREELDCLKRQIASLTHQLKWESKYRHQLHDHVFANRSAIAALQFSLNPIDEILRPSSENIPSEIPLEPTNFSDWMQPNNFANYLTEKLGKPVKVKNITDRFSKAKNKEQTPEGYEQFGFRGLILQRREAYSQSRGKHEYRLVGED